MSERPPSVSLSCDNLHKRFAAVQVIDGVSAHFQPGTVTALVGPNGAGKTTLFHLLAGALAPDTGRVVLGRDRIDGLPAWKVARQGVGRLFQDVRVFRDMTVLDNVRVAVPNQTGESPVAALVGMGTRGEALMVASEARRHLATVGLRKAVGRFARELSYGEQKLLALARLLATRAHVLLLDEPAAGISPRLRRVLLPLLRNLAREGRTVALIEHDLIAVREVADTVLFMDEGRILASGPPNAVLNDPALRATYLGTE